MLEGYLLTDYFNSTVFMQEHILIRNAPSLEPFPSGDVF